MKKHFSIDQLSTIARRQAQSEAALLQGELRKLRDAVARGTIHAPVIHAVRGKTKKTTSAQSLWGTAAHFGLVELAKAGLLDDTFIQKISASAKIGGVTYTDSFSQRDNGGAYASTAQSDGAVTQSLINGQRIR